MQDHEVITNKEGVFRMRDVFFDFVVIFMLFVVLFIVTCELSRVPKR